MQYIVQTNLLNDADLKTLTDAIEAEGVTWYGVKVIPFDHSRLEGAPEHLDGPVVVYGSTTLVAIAETGTWVPGAWIGPDFTEALAAYGDEMLNSDMVIHRFMEIPKFTGVRFIRPVKDNKAFPGQTIDGERFEAWQETVLALDVDTFPDTPCIVSTPKEIKLEYRFFVVDGRVVTGSMYMHNGQLYKAALTPEDEPVVRYAQSQVDRCQIRPAFVMDIAVMDYNFENMKILEINGFNAAGFYHSDVRAIIRAVNNMKF